MAVACRQPEATYPRIEPRCIAGRIVKVTVAGGSRDDVPQLAVLEGTLDDPDRTRRIAAVATDLLRARGYARARVAIARRAGCGVELVVSVDRGPRFRIANIAFVTDDGFPPEARVAALEDALGTVNTIGGAYVEDRLQRALAALARRYQELGWLDAEIDRPRAVFDDARGEVTLTIAVRAGRRFRIGNVVARGGKRATRAAVIQALGLRGGQWYDAARVRAGVTRARHEVGERLELRLAIDDDRIDLEAVVGEQR